MTTKTKKDTAGATPKPITKKTPSMEYQQGFAGTAS